MSAAVQQKPQINVKLSVVKGPHAGQVFHLNKEKMMIGRGPENDIVLMNDPQVSRSHAQIILTERDFEIIKISQKNNVLVDGETVDQWKLVSGSTFVVGDSEIKFEYDLGASVAIALKPKAIVPSAVPQVQKPSTLPKVPTQRSEQPLQKPSAFPAQNQPRHTHQNPNQARPLSAPKTNLLNEPRFRFYAIASVLILGLVLFIMTGTKAKSSKAKPTLKYEDEISIKLNSTPEKEKANAREETKKDRNSPQHLRAEENFIKGMRDYQLGNYLRAMEFFQVVLNLESDHQLARRHLYLSKVRFDELVQAKLMLGESYYSKHNFNMCASMYQQVMDMLDDKKADSKYKLAEKKNKECELASEGIR